MIESYEDIEANITECVAQGFTFSLDDFGKGYSNLKTLIILPFSMVKLDKELFYLGSSHHELLVNLVTTLRKMGKRVLVEGGETTQQLQQCRDLGVDYVQGYLLGKPVDLVTDKALRPQVRCAIETELIDVA